MDVRVTVRHDFWVVEYRISLRNGHTKPKYSKYISHHNKMLVYKYIQTPPIVTSMQDKEKNITPWMLTIEEGRRVTALLE